MDHIAVKCHQGQLKPQTNTVSESMRPFGSSGRMSSKRDKLIPAQKLTTGKRVSEYGTTATITYFAKKYLKTVNHALRYTPHHTTCLSRG